MSTKLGNGSRVVSFQVQFLCPHWVERDIATPGTYYARVGQCCELQLNGSYQLNVSLDNAVTGAVPEPATWAMMLLGFGGMGVALRRRKRSTQLAQMA